MHYKIGIYDPRSKTWLGKPAKEYSKDYPRCNHCQNKTRLNTPRKMDNEGNIRPAIFECPYCGSRVGDDPEFGTDMERDEAQITTQA
jgi:hypothetical protein